MNKWSNAELLAAVAIAVFILILGAAGYQFGYAEGADRAVRDNGRNESALVKEGDWGNEQILHAASTL